jgi:hypothetical protein
MPVFQSLQNIARVRWVLPLLLSVLPLSIVPVCAQTTTPGVGTGLSGLGHGPSPVLLGQAGNFVILAKTGISTTGTTEVTGDLGISPAAGSFITGFALIAPPTTYSTSARVTGKIYAADYDSPTPSNLTTAVLNMGTAYTDAAARPLDYTELGTGAIGGMTLAPAVYRWSGNVTLPTNVTLSGGPNDVWIFQIAGNLSLASAVSVLLQGGAHPRNIFWQVAGSVSLGTTSHFEGVLLAQTAIALTTGASANARFLSQTAVTLDANSVVQPSVPVSVRATDRSRAAMRRNNRVVITPGTDISFVLTPGVMNRIAVVDVWGRTQWTHNVKPLPGVRAFRWNGLKNNGERLNAGVYLTLVHVAPGGR